MVLFFVDVFSFEDDLGLALRGGGQAPHSDDDTEVKLQSPLEHEPQPEQLQLEQQSEQEQSLE